MLLPHATATQAAISYTIPPNRFGDTLPIIPKDSTVLFKSVLFRLDLEITVTRAGAPLAGHVIPIRSNRSPSHARQLAATDFRGKATVRLETRASGVNVLTPVPADYAGSTYSVTIDEAWYESSFLITAYNCCKEDDFDGDSVTVKNVGTRNKDFLFGGEGVCMEGTGLGTDGKFIAITNPTSIHWRPHYAGVANPDDAIFNYTDGVYGAFSKVSENQSIAIDPKILPPLHWVDIEGPRSIGQRRGDDTGGAIKGHHFDNYVGAGDDAMTAWDQAGGNIQRAQVKYLGA